MWARFAKGVLRTDHVDAQLGDGLPAEVVLGMPRATIADLDRAKAIVLVGPDLERGAAGPLSCGFAGPPSTSVSRWSTSRRVTTG